MAAIAVLVDTDVLIDYFNRGDHSDLLDDPANRIYYSVVTRKELLSKRGLRASERSAIEQTLRRLRVVPLSAAVTQRYALLRRAHPQLEKEDALIAATALVKRLPLMTRNWKHFRNIEGLTLYDGRR